MERRTTAGHHGFDPNSTGAKNAGVFGLPFTETESSVVLVPTPWDVTVSYGAGSSGGPRAILDASYQVDLYDSDNPDGWRRGIFMREPVTPFSSHVAPLRTKVESYIEFLEGGGDPRSNQQMQSVADETNRFSREFCSWLRKSSGELLDQGKLVGVIGGDHSTPLGFLQALADRHQSFGILQIDAHCDLREAYQGFEQSHASIMWNALKIPAVERLVQVGIRDYCDAELALVGQSNGRVRMFTDLALKDELYGGSTWRSICARIIEDLPQQVYISFDIDGLDPKLCPTTGTPVPGGLEFSEATFLIRELIRSGRTIIGFDLCEVAPGATEWDANVGARMLYKLCLFALLSRR